MGGQLVKSATAWLYLETVRGDPPTANERLILLHMCSTATDGDNPPRYWAGHQRLAEHALGRLVDLTLDAQQRRKAERSIRESVRQAISALDRRGAIERIGSAYPGHSQEYAIAVEKLLTGPDMGQAQLGSSTSTAWVNSKHSLSMPQAPIGPETNKTKNTKRDNQDHHPAPPHFRAVERTRP